MIDMPERVLLIILTVLCGGTGIGLLFLAYEFFKRGFQP
jgi:hypothetical protein